MGMELCISGPELRKALADIEAAEKNGFKHCLAVFKMNRIGPTISECQAAYSDMVERAHETDGSLSWGRFQGVTRRFKFRGGNLFPIKSVKPA